MLQLKKLQSNAISHCDNHFQIAATLPEKHEQFSGPDKSSGLATLSAWKSKCVESDDVKKCIREIPKEDIAKGLFYI